MAGEPRQSSVGAAGRPALLLAALVTSLVTPPVFADAPAVRYRHADHARLGVPLECVVCHDATLAGQPTFPGASQHTPCANAGCHADDFAAREPTVCLACHARRVPWGQNPVVRHLDGGEFGVRFSHSGHLARAADGALLGRGCAACHPIQAGGSARAPTPSVPAPGHAGCASCHLQLAKPHMGTCDGCHALGGGPLQPAAGDGRWRVGAKFSHAAHTRDPRTAAVKAPDAEAGWARYDAQTAEPLGCSACHAGMARVDVGGRVVRPTKAECAECHDGRLSFKVSGFGCHRCHAPQGGASTPSEAKP